MLGTSWAQLEPMLGLGWPMLGLCWPRLGLCWAFVGVCWPHVGLCWPYVELGICWLSWAYVGDMLGNLCGTIIPIQLFTIFSIPQSKTMEKTDVFF